MNYEIGGIYEGTVKTITQYGAFVQLDPKTTGMVHISEVANDYVTNINDHVKENDIVKVKFISLTPQGKISLSIKQALVSSAPESAPEPEPEVINPQQNFKRPKPVPGSFEDMMSKFKRSSEEKMGDLKRSNENKRKNTKRTH